MDFSNITLMPLVVLGCLCVGFIVKSTDILKDRYNRYIPLIVGVLGIVISVWIAINNGDNITPETIIYGLVSGLASTGMYQAFSAFINQKGE